MQTVCTRLPSPARTANLFSNGPNRRPHRETAHACNGVETSPSLFQNHSQGDEDITAPFQTTAMSTFARRSEHRGT